MLAYSRDLLNRTIATFWTVAKIMVPVMLAVRIADDFGLSVLIGRTLEPLMGPVGLPGEAGLVWGIAILTGFYGGIGALVALVATVDLTALQLNILLSLVLFAHAIPVEQAIVRQAGASFWGTTLLRLVSGYAFAFLLLHVSLAFGFLDRPATLGVMPTAADDGGWAGWFVSTGQALVFMFVVLIALLAVLDLLKRLGVFDVMTRAMTPFFSRLGIAPPLAPLVTIGMLLGLTYGGGLIVEEARKNAYTRAQLFTPLAALSIIHALVEDTAVAIALGGDPWVFLVWRTLFALVCIALIAAGVRLWLRLAIARKPAAL